MGFFAWHVTREMEQNVMSYGMPALTPCWEKAALLLLRSYVNVDLSLITKHLFRYNRKFACIHRF